MKVLGTHVGNLDSDAVAAPLRYRFEHVDIGHAAEAFIHTNLHGTYALLHAAPAYSDVLPSQDRGREAQSFETGLVKTGRWHFEKGPRGRARSQRARPAGASGGGSAS